MIERSTPWKLLSQRMGDVYALAQIGDNIHLSTGPIRLDGIEYLPIIASIPEPLTTVDYWTREFSFSDLTLEILNMPFQRGTRFSDILDRNGGLINKDVTVSLWLPGINTLADCLQIFKGVYRQPTYGRESLAVDTLDATTLDIQRIVLDKVPESAAADSDAGLPTETITEVDPMVYGLHQFNKGRPEKSYDTFSDITNAPRCKYLGRDSGGLHRWRVSKHKVDSIEVAPYSEIRAYDDTLKKLVQIANMSVLLNNDTDGCIVRHQDNPTYIDTIAPQSVVSNTKTGGVGVQIFTNPDRVADKAFNVAATATMDQVAGAVLAGNYVSIVADYAPWGLSALADSEILIVHPVYYGKLHYSAFADDNNAVIQIEGVNQTIHPTAANYPEDRVTPNGVPFPATQAAVAANMDLRLSAPTNYGGAERVDFDVYEMYKDIYYHSPTLLDLRFAGSGFGYPDWINNRSTADGFIVSHVDSGDAGIMIQNRAGIIEAYLRDVLGVPGDKINEESFNAASVVLDGVAGSFAVDDKIDTLATLFELAQSYDCFMYWDSEGKISIVALADDYTTPDYVVDGDLLIDLEYSQTDLEDIYTGVETEYSGLTDGSARGVTPLVEDATAQAANSVTLTQSHLEFPSVGYYGLPEAENINNAILQNSKLPHNQMRARLPLMFDHFAVGTILGFKNLPILLNGEDLSESYTIGDQTIRPNFIVVEAQPSKDFGFLAVQIHKRD